MTIKTLKKYIHENNKVEFVLDSIGCHNIKHHPNKDFYSCGNYNGDNIGAINVYNNEYLNVTNWTRTKEFDESSDIITLTQYNKQCSFVDAVKYLHSILGLEYSRTWKQQKKEKKFDPLAIFKRRRSKSIPFDPDEIRVLDESVLDEYIPILHIDWLKEGIAPWARDKFGICYSYKRKRVVIPHRHWLTGQLLGVNMRTTIEDSEELGIRKYYLTEGYNKSSNLYGLYENYEEIKKAGYVVVFESEKSVLKNYSRDGHDDERWKHHFNGKTGVAISGKTISEEQRRILIGLGVEIIIALDNDVSIDEVRHVCDLFYGIRRVSYIKDTKGILGEKDSPADADNSGYDILFNICRERYDEEEHNLYLKSLEK